MHLSFHNLTVLACTPLAEDAISIRLAIPEHLRAAFNGRAGQHVVARANVAGTEQRRTYSVVSAPGADPLEIGVRIHPDGVLSRHLARHLKSGATLEVMPPAGSFNAASVGSGQTVLLLAAGCGITPILAITRDLLERHPHNRCVLVYGNRSGARSMYLEALQQLKDRYLARLDLHFVMSREPQDVDLGNGRIDAALLRRLAAFAFDPTQLAGCWVCGPGSMNDSARSTLLELGADGHCIHEERFSVDSAVPAPARTSPAAATPGDQPTAADDSVPVTVIMDGRERSFAINPGDTVLQAGLDAGLDLPFSCCGGVCSTCRVKVIAGAVAMDVNYALEDWELELGFVLACQARPVSEHLTISYDQR